MVSLVNVTIYIGITSILIEKKFLVYYRMVIPLQAYTILNFIHITFNDIHTDGLKLGLGHCNMSLICPFSPIFIHFYVPFENRGT